MSLKVDTASSDDITQVLGYLNFSSGAVDLNFIGRFDRLFGQTAERGEPILPTLERILRDGLSTLAHRNGTFRDSRQAEWVVRVLFEQLLPLYRQHHRELLAHHNDETLYNGFFLARAARLIVARLDSELTDEQVARQALRSLNDYIGYRPVATLESRDIAPYPHESVAPIPIYLRGIGAAYGPYRELIEGAVQILFQTDEALLRAAHFSPDRLDELAIDPRAFDFDHPANKRPNHHFGQWDPHQLDGEHRFRRFVVHQVTLDALSERIRPDAEIGLDELRFEASAVLAGTILMASGISGYGPDAHDSSTTLDSLLPTIAAYRDAFYERLIASLAGSHRERLLKESEHRRQPFGGARQHLNAKLAERRAAQLVHVHLSSIYARMGFLEAAQRQASIVPAASARIRCQIDCLVSAGHQLIKEGALEKGLTVVPEIMELVQSGVGCGAIVDPWNMLGFDGNFSLFPAQANTIRDHRIDELVELIEHVLAYCSQLLGEAAAVDNLPLCGRIKLQLESIAHWWYQYAPHEVSSTRAVNPKDIVRAAEHVAQALNLWHKGGASAGNMEFWAEHVKMFDSPQAYALVIDALLLRHDLATAMALLIHWLSRSRDVPLQQGDCSFHEFLRRWSIQSKDQVAPHADNAKASAEKFARLRKAYDHLEANAEEYGAVPDFELQTLDRPRSETGSPPREGDKDDGDDDSSGQFRAAYDGLVYRDTTDDGIEGEIFDSNLADEDELEAEADRVAERLEYLQSMAHFWATAATWPLPPAVSENKTAPPADFAQRREVIFAWLTQASQNRADLSQLLQAVSQYRLPPSNGDHDSLIEYDRKRLFKESLMDRIITAAIETDNAIRLLGAAIAAIDYRTRSRPLDEVGGPVADERPVIAVFAAVLLREPKLVSEYFEGLLDHLHQRALLYVPLSRGGDPHDIVATRARQDAIVELLKCLPRLGMLTQAHELCLAALAMERNHGIGVGAVTEFDELFKIAFSAMVEALARASRRKPGGEPAGEIEDEGAAPSRIQALFDCVEMLTESMLLMWLDHSRTLRLSVLEKVSDKTSWLRLVEFIMQYGEDLFTQRLLQLGNVRAILHQGAEVWLAQLEDSPEGEDFKLIRELDRGIARTKAARYLTLVFEAIIENYNEYRDYNSTTTQSDQGDLLHMFLDFLRLRVRYDRVCWHLRPVIWAHRILIQAGEQRVAQMWRRSLAERVRTEADRYLEKFEKLRQQYSMQMVTVHDRLAERFVHPMQIDRMRSLVAQAMAKPGSKASRRAFDLLEQEVNQLTIQPMGIGMELPSWLAALEEEVDLCELPKYLRKDVESPCLIEPLELTLASLHEQLEQLPHRG
jgi:hypothetical protein